MRILVTGSGSGIGRATVQVLADRGHDVVATARRVDSLDDLPAAARLPLDVTDDESVATCVAAAGPLDAVVNNAGLSIRGPLELIPFEDIRAVFETNLFGPLRLIRAVLPSMRERGAGVIVNVGSVEGKVATPLSGSYSATKHALEGLSDTLHLEVGHFGIRVVVIEPGYIAPGMKPRDGVDETGTPYEELRRQWDGTDAKLLGDQGRPPPELVGEAIARAVEDPSTPRRIPVGADAELVLATRRQLDDDHFEAAMRQTLNLTW